jgi:hypothetical protein
MRLEAQGGRMKSEDTHSLLPALSDLYRSSRARVDYFITAHFGKLHRRTHCAGGGHNGGYVIGSDALIYIALNTGAGPVSARDLTGAGSTYCVERPNCPKESQPQAVDINEIAGAKSYYETTRV